MNNKIRILFAIFILIVTVTVSLILKKAASDISINKKNTVQIQLIMDSINEKDYESFKKLVDQDELLRNLFIQKKASPKSLLNKISETLDFTQFSFLREERISEVKEVIEDWFMDKKFKKLLVNEDYLHYFLRDFSSVSFTVLDEIEEREFTKVSVVFKNERTGNEYPTFLTFEKTENGLRLVDFSNFNEISESLVQDERKHTSVVSLSNSMEMMKDFSVSHYEIVTIASPLLPGLSNLKKEKALLSMSVLNKTDSDVIKFFFKVSLVDSKKQVFYSKEFNSSEIIRPNSPKTITFDSIDPLFLYGIKNYSVDLLIQSVHFKNGKVIENKEADIKRIFENF